MIYLHSKMEKEEDRESLKDSLIPLASANTSTPCCSTLTNLKPESQSPISVSTSRFSPSLPHSLARSLSVCPLKTFSVRFELAREKELIRRTTTYIVNLLGKFSNRK